MNGLTEDDIYDWFVSVLDGCRAIDERRGVDPIDRANEQQGVCRVAARAVVEGKTVLQTPVTSSGVGG